MSELENNTINLYWMYPDMLNLHGDRGNIIAFGKIAEKLGVTLNVTKIESIKEKIDYEKADILFFNPGELKVIRTIIQRLQQDIKQVEKFVSDNKYIFAIGTTGSLFAEETTTVKEEKIKGLGILNMYCKEREMVIGDDLYFAIEDKQEIIGSQIHMLDFEVAENSELGKIKYGYGNNGTKTEGSKTKNLIFTNSLGPVMVKNPWWTENILLQIANKKGIKTKEIPIEEYELEVKSFNSIKEFINKKQYKNK